MAVAPDVMIEVVSSALCVYSNLIVCYGVGKRATCGGCLGSVQHSKQIRHRPAAACGAGEAVAEGE